MEKRPPRPAQTGTGTLVKAIIHDGETLLGQHVQLLRAEIREELDNAKHAAIALGAGGGLVATASLLSAFMFVHALNRATRWPLWVCYSVVAGALGISGAQLMVAGRTQAARIKLWPPKQTAAALKEDLQWLKEQVT